MIKQESITVNEFKIKEATLYDVEPLALLYQEYRIFFKEEPNYEKEVEFLYSRVKNRDSVIFVAKNIKGMITGFTQLYPLFSSTRMKRLWLLNDLYVKNHYRGKGISKLLISKAKKVCIDTDSCELILEIEKNNEIANQLYIRTGFKLDKAYNFYSWNP